MVGVVTLVPETKNNVKQVPRMSNKALFLYVFCTLNAPRACSQKNCVQRALQREKGFNQTHTKSLNLTNHYHFSS